MLPLFQAFISSLHFLKIIDNSNLSNEKAQNQEHYLSRQYTSDYNNQQSTFRLSNQWQEISPGADVDFRIFLDNDLLCDNDIGSSQREGRDTESVPKDIREINLIS